MREAPSPSPLPFFVFPLLARVSFSWLFLSERSTDEPRIDLCNLSFWLGSEALTSPWPPGFGSLNHFWCARVPVYVLLVFLFLLVCSICWFWCFGAFLFGLTDALTSDEQSYQLKFINSTRASNFKQISFLGEKLCSCMGISQSLSWNWAIIFSG